MTWRDFGWLFFLGVAVFLAMTVINAGHHP